MSESEPTLYGNPVHTHTNLSACWADPDCPKYSTNPQRATPAPNEQPRLTDAQLAQQWARKAANEDRLDLASALYAIAGRARRVELAEAKTDHEQGLRGLRESYEKFAAQLRPTEQDMCSQLPGCRNGEHNGSCEVSLDRADQIAERTRVVPLIGATRTEQPRSHAPTTCQQCNEVIQWMAGGFGECWYHLDTAIISHEAKPAS